VTRSLVIWLAASFVILYEEADFVCMGMPFWLELQQIVAAEPRQ
jgi:hypothetical protein